MKVVLNNRSGNFFDFRDGGLVRPTRLASVFYLLVVHLHKEIKGHQSKVHGPASGIEERHFADEFKRTRHLHWQGYEIGEALLESSVRMHFQPQSAQRVLYQVADHPTYGE